MNKSNEQEKRRERFEQFFRTTFPKVKAFAWKIVKSEDDAEDIAQDIFVKFWDNPAIWEKQEASNGYIYAMTKNHIFNFLKHISIEQTYQEQLTKESSLAQEAEIYQQLYTRETELLIRLTIDQMPAQRKNIFAMSRDKGMSNAEIAEQLHISIRTVERHLYLALADLKKIKESSR